MFHDTDATHGHESAHDQFGQATTPGRQGQRTVEGAVLTTLAIPAAVVAASYPVAVAVAVGAAVGLLVARYTGRDAPPGGDTRSDGARSEQVGSLPASD